MNRIPFHAASVPDRFFHGIELPDEAQSLKDFVHKLDPATAAEAAEMLARLFCRPVFETPIHQESSLPAFRQAIADAIGALSTGIWRDREEAVISRVPSISDFSDSLVADNFRKCVNSLNKLRIAFDEGIRTNGIRPCKCGTPECSQFVFDEKYRLLLEVERTKAMSYANQAPTIIRAAHP